jgi:hypothetical protein
MARLKTVKHILTVGTEKYSLKVPDIYSDFKAIVGVEKAPSPDTTTYTDKLNADDFANGKAVKIKVRATKKNIVGNSTEKREFTLVCAFAKAQNALANLEGEEISIPGIGGETAIGEKWIISTARIPRRRRFS